MPKIHLTDIALRNLKPPPSGQVTWWDDALPGFNCRVGQRGSKLFTVVYGTDRKRVSIGRYPDLSLSDARAAARRILADASTTPVAGPLSLTFKQGLRLYLESHCARHNRPRTNQEIERLLTKHFLPKFGKRAMHEISLHDVSAVIDALMDTPSEANHAFAAIRAMMRFAARRRIIPYSPCDGLQMPARRPSRSRVLTDAECVAVYRAGQTIGYPYGTIVMLLLLTGQRRNEIAQLDRSHIDQTNQTITLPAELTKNHRAHTFPLAPLTRDALASIAERNGRLFPARGNDDTTFSGWSKSKARLDQLCEIDPWTLHDLRRTFATQLASLATPPHIVERLLNHATGRISGVAAVYNRYQYMDEMRAALEQWEAKLTRLVQSATLAPEPRAKLVHRSR